MGQSRRVASKIHASKELTAKIEAVAQKHAAQFSFSKTPVEAATPLYEELAKVAQKIDLYGEAKLQATKQAISMIPQLQKMIDHEPDQLTAAGKMAVAGNVIDLATEDEFDLTETVERVLHAKFGEDYFQQLFHDLADAQTLLYLADNAGEHIFDSLFLKQLNKSYPDLKITYMTRGNAIINDVTLEEAIRDGLTQYAVVESSGMPTPGFIYDKASPEVQKKFLEADVVIAKGMGNFETMTEVNLRDVYHLFKVKCSVVSKFTGFAVGTFMALKRFKQ